jgi:hypothetical protein
LKNLDRDPALVEHWYRNLDTDNPDTLKHVMISSYKVLLSHTLDTESEEAIKAMKDSKEKAKYGIYSLKHLQ